MKPEARIFDVFEEILVHWARYLFLFLSIIVGAGIWAFTATPIFRSEATVSIVTESAEADVSGNLGLGNLAALAGFPLASQSRRVETLALLEARATGEEFIRREGLVGPLLGATWDQETEEWRTPGRSRPVTLASAYETWRKRVLRVNEERETGLVRVAVEWRDPVLAAEWNRRYLRFVDSRIRGITLTDTDRSLAYLKSQLSATQEIEVRRALAQLMEGHLNTATIARGREWYALRVLDPPHVPTQKYKPARVLIMLLASILSIVVVLLIAVGKQLLATASPLRYKD